MPPTMTATPNAMTATPESHASTSPVDPLELVPRVLDLVRLSGAIFLKSDFHAPWSYTSPPAPQMAGALPALDGHGSLVMLHVVAEGSCWVSLDGGPRMELSAGDVVVMPYGD